MTVEAKGRMGGSFADFLDEQGDRAEVEEQAVRALVADQVEAAMAEAKLTKAEMARRMHTTRPA